jgi:inositol-phosphate transport system ATP-binding protein
LASIRLEDICLEYMGKEVCSDVNLSVEDGELCALVGPSGCGKSVLLRIIAGLIKPTSGSVYIDGQLANDVPAADRDVAMVFQSFALYPYMTVRENWAFPLRAGKLPKQDIDARINTVSEFLEMDPLLDRRPKQLSGGQQQRAALGRALVRRPRLFLLDEPLGSQDAKKRIELGTELKKLQMDLGITTVLVTNDQIEAQALGDKLAVMDIGSLQQLGAPEEVYERPVNLFVARFIGSPAMNLFDCTLDRENGELYLNHPRFRVPLPPDVASRVEATVQGDEVVLGVRPEHITVRLDEQPDTIPAKIYVLEPQSNEMLIDLRVADLVVRTRADREDLGFQPRLDQKVFLTLDKEFMHVFDKATELRMN